MKLYCAGKLLNRVEDQEYTLLTGASITIGRRGRIKKDNWGSGWVFDADDSFRSWCSVAYGFEPVVISDLEYAIMMNDGVVYLSAERTSELHKVLSRQLSLIAINS